jgi:flagellar biogenesis protein FliO
MNYQNIVEQVIAGVAVIALLAAMAWVRKLYKDINHAFTKIRSLENAVRAIKEKL